MVHIGDSRAYMLRDGEFAPDHQGRHVRPDAGRRGPDQRRGGRAATRSGRCSPGRSTAATSTRSTRCARPARRPLPDLQRRPLRRGQRRDHRRDAAGVRRPATSAPSGWSQLALRGGGPDNITVIVADVTDEDIVEAAPIVGGAAARDRGMATSADDSTPAARASAAHHARAPAAAGRAGRRPTTTTSRPAPPPGAHRAAAGRAAGRARRRPLGRLARTPSRSTTSASPSDGRSPSSGACPGRSPASTCPSVKRPAAPSSTTSPTSRRSGSSRASRPSSQADAAAEAGRADHRRPARTRNLKPACPPDARRRAIRRRRPATPTDAADEPDRVGADRDRRRRPTGVGAPTSVARRASRPSTAADRSSTRADSTGRPTEDTRDRRRPFRLHSTRGDAVELPRVRRRPRPRRNAELACSLFAMALVGRLRGGRRGRACSTRSPADFWVPAAILSAIFLGAAPGRSGSSRRTPTRCCCRPSP